MYLKWRIPAKQANNSLSKAEYFCWAASSFFEKKLLQARPYVRRRRGCPLTGCRNWSGVGCSGAGCLYYPARHGLQDQ
jgi:hypothetical protein